MNFEQIKQNLIIQQTQLSKRIEAIKSDFTHQRSADFAEQVTEQENEEVLVQLLDDAVIELSLVNTALKKIADEQFGLCEKCGEEINLDRLTVIPYTPFCINCA